MYYNFLPGKIISNWSPVRSARWIKARYQGVPVTESAIESDDN